MLFAVVQKIYKTRMPSTLQSLILVFARLIQTNPKEIVELLSETSVDNRISLKVVLDKWLLQQPLFRGTYTKTVTLTALLKLFMMRDSRIESLMVIGYNPSHSNVNSEVNAPFKILSTLLRFMKNEEKLLAAEQGVDSNLNAYKMPRKKATDVAMDSGERLDTMEGFNDLYDEEEDEDDGGDGDNANANFLNGSDDEDEAVDLLGSPDSKPKKQKQKNKFKHDKIEVNLDDIEDDDEEQEGLLDYNQKQIKPRKHSTAEKQQRSERRMKAEDDSSLLIGDDKDDKNGKDFDNLSSWSDNTAQQNLFKIKESMDKGLADMETGSEVYMSELLVSTTNLLIFGTVFYPIQMNLCDVGITLFFSI